MLSASHQKAYQEFLVLLTELQENVRDEGYKIDLATIKERLRQLQQYFEKEIASLSAENSSAAIAPRWQAIQRELIREFRLLSTDVLFLTSARQTATREARLTAIGDRLNKLIDYSQTLISRSQ